MGRTVNARTCSFLWNYYITLIKYSYNPIHFFTCYNVYHYPWHNYFIQMTLPGNWFNIHVLDLHKCLAAKKSRVIDQPLTCKTHLLDVIILDTVFFPNGIKMVSWEYLFRVSLLALCGAMWRRKQCNADWQIDIIMLLVSTLMLNIHNIIVNVPEGTGVCSVENDRPWRLQPYNVLRITKTRNQYNQWKFIYRSCIHSGIVINVLTYFYQSLVYYKLNIVWVIEWPLNKMMHMHVIIGN